MFRTSISPATCKRLTTRCGKSSPIKRSALSRRPFVTMLASKRVSIGEFIITVFNRSPERATFPLLDYEADLKVLQNPDEPFTVGDSDPVKREQEAFGVVASSYEPIEIRFSSFTAPRSGRYKLRFKGYTFWASGRGEKVVASGSRKDLPRATI